MGALPREVMLEVLFDADGNFCGHRVQSDGRPGVIAARYRHVFEHAFRLQAKGFVLVHNHPSGNLRPSRQDVTATRALAAVARAMDVEFFDHLIIAGNSAMSMRKAGFTPWGSDSAGA
jgi:DNA repair protein RadC